MYNSPKYFNRLTPEQRKLCAQAWDCCVAQRKRNYTTQFPILVYWDAHGDLDWAYTSTPEAFLAEHYTAMKIESSGKITFYDKRFRAEVRRFLAGG